ncbi:response regulator transcription factor [Methylobacterium ajmalii]|jgi:DNA-binding NarL/FixJ family response regulator|uniref:LuxR C-terminal-related transcriptional regulator n=1 Tax=Methylobacterium ajmalii TaxID=2738439 RepID=UPI00190AEFF7|nr:response regulator transcription factor [Methylobacterium ajmalii]MBK3397709.1 response regulator transcription factor [Methylobacterium ajmalii]MBK3411686.1 response regulator transcription factor [Methylobacterium ajmalii]MBK3425455.1 response regulator transcription factor [Methylobacterium ajmalii]MBZ6414784.1 response regulator transcription factor [Methylobacterium sp.]
MTSITGKAVVADDYPFFRIALTSILRDQLGISEVQQVGSLDEALEALAEKQDVRFALFDLAMPGMESPASLSAVRECFPEVLTVVVSGSTEREDVFLALKAGVHGFVPKGSDVESLIRALRMVVDGFVYVPAFVTRVPGGASGAPTPTAWREAAADPTAALTPRQRQVLDLIVAGQSNKEIARSLSLGEGTVKIHVAALLKALGVPNRSAAAAWGGANLARPRATP